MIYEIWVDNGISTLFETNTLSFKDVLNEFYIKAGYLNFDDACVRLGIEDINIKPLNEVNYD